MKSQLFTFVLLFLTVTIGFAQKEKKVSPKHENHFQLPSVAGDGYKATMTDAFSKLEMLNSNVQIENLSADYLVWKREQTELIFPTNTYKAEKSLYFIKPGKKITKSLNHEGGSGYHADKFTIKIDGVYRLPIDGESVAAPDFQLPVTRQTVEASPFLISVKGNVKQESSETVAAFKITYNGSKFGLVRQNRLVCRIPNGDEYPSDNTDFDVEVLAPGESCTVKAVFNIPRHVLDMQYSVLNVVWKDSFQESDIKPLRPVMLEMELDAQKTADQN